MVIFIGTREGFEEIVSIIQSGKFPVWLNYDVLTEDEIEDLRSSRLDITRFNYPIDISNQESLLNAFQVISEHHPDERIWSEFKLNHP